jgi:hypothetical protein
MIPEQCAVRDLSGLDRLTGPLTLRLFSSGDKGLTRKVGLHRRISVPLVDGEEEDVPDVLILDAIAAAEEAQGEDE